MKDGSIGTFKFNYLNIYYLKTFREGRMMDGQTNWRRQDRDRFLVQAGIKLNFSEFILIFDLVIGFYCSGQKSRQNMEIKSY
jgi:hypothetical protein